MGSYNLSFYLVSTDTDSSIKLGRNDNLFITELLLLCLSIFFFVLYRTKSDFQRFQKTHKGRLQELRGPSQFFLFTKILSGLRQSIDPFKENLKLVQEYGATFGVKFFFLFDLVFMSDPIHIKKLLTSNEPGHIQKPTLLYGKILDGNIKDGLVCADYDIWKPHRKLFQKQFTYTGIQHQLSVVNYHANILINNLLQSTCESDRNAGYDKDTYWRGKLNKMLTTTALNSILHVIFGCEIASEEESQQFYKNGMKVNAASAQRTLRPWLLLPWIWRFHPLKREINKASAESKEFIYEIMGRYKKLRSINPLQSAEDAEFKCMMEEMIESGFSDEEMYQEALTMIVAGMETTSSSISYLLLRLALNRDMQEKCRQELDALLQNKLQENSDPALSMNDLSSLEYLDRCVKESLRLCPVFPFIGRRIDVPLKLENNLVLKEGSIVAISPYVAHRNPQIYPDPEKFDPDRFLPEEVAKRHPYAYIPFSGGSRNCIGWKVAALSIKLVTGLILRNFVVETKDKWEDLEFIFDTSLTTKRDIHISLRVRP